MAESIRATATAAPADTSGVISAARGGTLNVKLAEVPTSVGYLAVGSTVADPPAAYNDLTNDRGGAVVGAGLSLSSNYNADDGLYAMTVRVTIGTTTYAEGDKVWAAWFEGSLDTPGSRDVPTLVSAGFPVSA